MTKEKGGLSKNLITKRGGSYVQHAASGCSKGLAKGFVNVPLQLPCQNKQPCGTLRNHFTKPLEQPDAPE